MHRIFNGLWSACNVSKSGKLNFVSVVINPTHILNLSLESAKGKLELYNHIGVRDINSNIFSFYLSPSDRRELEKFVKENSKSSSYIHVKVTDYSGYRVMEYDLFRN